MSFIPEKELKMGEGMHWFIGVVEDIDDPLKANRVRVRVFGDHSQKLSRIETEHLAWGGVILPTTSAGVSGIGTNIHGLVAGSHVVGFWSDGADKQLPIILGSLCGITQADAKDGETTKIGFHDPSGVIPLDQYLGESDVNRLTRDWANHPIMLHRVDAQITGIGVFSSTWSEPQSSGAPVYPHNQTFETRHGCEADTAEPASGQWGSIEEWDATPGNNRYHRFHKSGTFIEISENGDELRKVIGEDFLIDMSNKKVLIKGDYLVTVEGNKEEYIHGNLSQKIDGNLIQDVGKACTRTVGTDNSETIGASHSKTVGSTSLHNASGAVTITGSTIGLVGDTTVTGDLTVSGVVHCSFFDGTAAQARRAFGH
jgi:hypothetical protein